MPIEKRTLERASFTLVAPVDGEKLFTKGRELLQLFMETRGIIEIFGG
jgi:hypothetical protein